MTTSLLPLPAEMAELGLIYARPTYRELALRYPLMLTVVELSSITRESVQTIRNRLCQNTYPIMPVRVDRRVLFRLRDVAEYLDSLADMASCQRSVQSLGKARAPRRGRPTKVEQLTRLQAKTR